MKSILQQLHRSCRNQIVGMKRNVSNPWILSFEFGCSLDLYLSEQKMELADVVCASEEIATKAGTTGRQQT